MVTWFTMMDKIKEFASVQHSAIIILQILCNNCVINGLQMSSTDVERRASRTRCAFGIELKDQEISQHCGPQSVLWSTHVKYGKGCRFNQCSEIASNLFWMRPTI